MLGFEKRLSHTLVNGTLHKFSRCPEVIQKPLGECQPLQLGNEVGALRATVGGLRMYISELSSTVGALVAERGGLPEDGGGLSGPPGGPLPWLGRAFGPPSYAPGFPHAAPLAPPFSPSPPSSVPVKL